MSSLLELDRISLKSSLGPDFILTSISLKVEPGEFIALLGPSGAGKTSLLKLINRLKSASSGSIHFRGENIKTLSAIALRRQVMLVGQECRLLDMTVSEALHYPLELQGISESQRAARVSSWLDQLQIPKDWLQRTELDLSGGQQQRVAIARALVTEPALLLLDEPTSAQDLGTATRILSAIQTQVREHGLSVIMSNHQLDLAKTFCDRLLYLDQGRLIRDQPASEVDWQELRHFLLSANERNRKEWDDFEDD